MKKNNNKKKRDQIKCGCGFIFNLEKVNFLLRRNCVSNRGMVELFIRTPGNLTGL